jgi:hypothetical protein
MVLVNRIVNLRFPQDVGKLLSSCATGGSSGRPKLHGVSQLAYWRPPKAGLKPDLQIPLMS